LEIPVEIVTTPANPHVTINNKPVSPEDWRMGQNILGDWRPNLLRIYYERSGGFAGISVKVNLDTNVLPLETAHGIVEALSAARFFELPEILLQSTRRADQFVYHLVVDDGDRQHTVEMDDSSVPTSLQPILRQLNLLARKPGNP